MFPREHVLAEIIPFACHFLKGGEVLWVPAHQVDTLPVPCAVTVIRTILHGAWQEADTLFEPSPVVVPEAVSIRAISTLLCTQPLAVRLLLAGPQGVAGGGGGGVAVVLEAGVPLLLLITRTQPQFNYSPLDWAVARATRGSYDNVKFPYLILFRGGEGGGRVFH